MRLLLLTYLEKAIMRGGGGASLPGLVITKRLLISMCDLSWNASAYPFLSPSALGSHLNHHCIFRSSRSISLIPHWPKTKVLWHCDPKHDTYRDPRRPAHQSPSLQVAKDKLICVKDTDVTSSLQPHSRGWGDNVSSIISKQQGQCHTIIIAYCPLYLGMIRLMMLFSVHVNVAERANA